MITTTTTTMIMCVNVGDGQWTWRTVGIRKSSKNEGWSIGGHLTLTEQCYSKVKVEVTSICIDRLRERIWHTQCYLQTTPCLPLPRKHSPRGRHHAYTHSERLSSTYYSFIDPKRMNCWVGYVGWHTADVRYRWSPCPLTLVDFEPSYI